MKKLKVLMLFDGQSSFPEGMDFAEALEGSDWNSEFSVARAVKKLGHTIKPLGFYDDIDSIIKQIRDYKPDVVFNLAEAYLGKYYYDRNIPALLELLQLRYTGCNPTTLMICNNKALTKKILTFHKIKVPEFTVYRKGNIIKLPKRFKPPFFIKPLKEEASMGITLSSLAETEKDFFERVAFIHNNLKTHAIVEEYIEGRELYVGVMGHTKPVVFPVWEMKFTQMPENDRKIATYKAKWDKNYRKRWGIKNEAADPFPDGIEEKIKITCKKAFKKMNLDGQIRFDLRLTPDNEVYIIEANANPELAQPEDFAASAVRSGMSYERLIYRIITQALEKK